MDIKDVNINNINSLTPEELNAVKRQGYKNLVLLTAIALIARSLRKKA